MSGWRFPDFPLQNIPPGRLDKPNSTATASFSTNHSTSYNNPNFRPQEPSNHEEGYQGDEEDGDQAGDPRNIHRQVPVRKEKSAREKLLHAMIRAFLVEAGHYLSNQEIQTLVQLPDGPNPLSVESYANRLGKGPSEDRPLFSWSHSVAHPWNIAVIRILTSKFRAYSIQNGLPKLLQLLNPSHRANTSTIDLDALVEFGDVEKLITEKIGYQQSRLRGAMRNIHSMQGKTGAEIGSALLSKSVAERTRARRNERRRNLFVRRATIIEEQLRLKSDSELWQQIDLLFSRFGDEDISSDETDIEKGFGAPKVVRRVRKVWVSGEISKVFHFIDGHYNSRTMRGTLKKGSAPLKRERESYKCNSLAPPRPMLPINFYSQEIGNECIRTLEPTPMIPIPQISLTGSEMEVDYEW